MLPRLLSRLIHSLPVFLGLLMVLFLTAGRSAASPGIIDGSSFFQQAPEYSSGAPDAYQVVVADLNGDGIPDAVVTHSCYGCANGTVSVLLGIGGGAFQPAVTYNTGGTNPIGLAVGDVNGDGKPDIVVANGASQTPPPTIVDVVSNTVAVLLGNGDGTFQPAATYSSGVSISGSGGLALADLNGDGKLDVALTTFTNALSTAGVSVLLGKGDGTFGPPVNYNVVSGGVIQGTQVIVSDVNGDGKPDLILPLYCTLLVGGVCNGGGVGILLGNGDGTFQPAVTYNTTANVSSAAVAEVNGDGKPDLVVGSSSGVQLLLGNGNGTFQAPVTLVSYAALGVQSVSLADVNGDGKLDLLAVASFNQSGPGSLVVMLGNENGTFQPERIFSSVGYGLNSLAVADVNADGKLDVLITNSCASNGNSDPLLCTAGSLAVLLGNGDGTFRGAPEYYTPADLYTGQTYSTEVIAAGDLNGDGKADLVVSYPGTNLGGKPQLEVLLNNGDGTFGAPTPTLYAYLATAVSVGDVNNDGKLDVIAGSGCTSFTYCQANNSQFGSVTVQLGNGDGTFTSGAGYLTGGTVVTSIAVADVNGDGRPDLLVANTCSLDTNCTNGVISVLLGTGNGAFQQPVDYSSGGQGTLSIAVSDVNGDGHPDLIVTNGGCGDSGYCAVVPYVVSVLLGNGDGTFQPAVSYATGGMSPVAVVVGDMNGDGKPDLVVGNNACPGIDRVCGNANVAVLLGNGDGTFQTPLTASVPGLWDGNLVLADFNGDGKLDVAGSGQGSGDFVLLGNGDGTLQPSFDVGAAWPGVVGADLTGQGKPSLVFGGGITVLLNSPPPPTTTMLVSSANPSYLQQAVTLTATVTGQSPTGTVRFTDNGANLATAPLVNGQASYTAVFSSAGMHSITAVYSGDGMNLSSTSAVLNQNVLQPVVTFSGSPQQPLTTDSSGNFIAQVTITNTGNITVSSVQVTSGTLGAGSMLSAPAAITDLAPGQSAVFTLTFPASSVPAGATTAALKVSGTYSIPSVQLSGNWSLSFRGVTL